MFAFKIVSRILQATDADLRAAPSDWGAFKQQQIFRTRVVSHADTHIQRERLQLRYGRRARTAMFTPATATADKLRALQRLL